MLKQCFALVLATAGVAVAAPIAIPNASFEAGTGYWAAPQWATAGDGSAVQEVRNLAVAGKDGNNFLQLAVEGGASGSPPTETAYQFSGDLGTFQANTTYTLTVAIAHEYDWNPSDLMKAGLGFATGTTPASVIASNFWSMRNGGGGTDLVTYNQFTDKTFVLTTGNADAFLGQPIRVALVFEHGGQYFRNARFDNVRLDASPVPEPAMMGLVAASSLLALRRRRMA